jgi:hypothetical protein
MDALQVVAWGLAAIVCAVVSASQGRAEAIGTAVLLVPSALLFALAYSPDRFAKHLRMATEAPPGVYLSDVERWRGCAHVSLFAGLFVVFWILGGEVPVFVGAAGAGGNCVALGRRRRLLTRYEAEHGVSLIGEFGLWRTIPKGEMYFIRENADSSLSITANKSPDV